MDKKLAPIVLFTYNRPEHTQQVLDALALNNEAKESILYIYCDGAKPLATEQELEKINIVKSIATKEHRFKEVVVIEQQKNKGLANSIIDGVSEIINEHGKIIVLEDDIKVELGFLNYMNTALDCFENKQEVFHINGFNNESNLQYLLKDYYFLHFMSCWGWATWKDRWSKINKDYHYFYNKLHENPADLAKFNYDNVLNFDEQLKANIDGKIKTWAILWFSTVYFNNGLCLTPKYSFVENIGMDGTGIHCDVNENHKKLYHSKNVPLIDFYKKLEFKEPKLAKIHLKMFYKYGQHFSYFHKIKEIVVRNWIKLKSIIKKLIGYKKEILIEQIQCKKKWYGNDYGGFFVHPTTLNEKSIVYSFGIGEDISFDEAIINNHGATVFAFDPTPKSINWIKQQQLPTSFHFYDFGIDIIDGKRIFHLPINDGHVSGSIHQPNHVAKNKQVEVNMKSISSILKELNHSKIDVLKMDIEGSEYDVLEDLLNVDIEINQLLIEFHDRFFEHGQEKSKAIIKKLAKKGFLIFGISASKEEISFIHKRMLHNI